MSEPPVTINQGNSQAEGTEYGNLSMVEPMSQNSELYKLQINSVWESWMLLSGHIEMFVRTHAALQKLVVSDILDTKKSKTRNLFYSYIGVASSENVPPDQP